MIQKAVDVILQSAKGLRRIHEEMLKLTEHQRDGLPSMGLRTANSSKTWLWHYHQLRYLIGR